MDTSSLATEFDRLSDDALLELAGAGGLTQEALAVARMELTTRGLAVPSVAAVAEESEGVYLGDMVLLERGLMPTEAHLLVSCLRAAGIEASAGDTNVVQANSLLTIALGGSNIRVPSLQAQEASAVLAAYRRGEFALGEDFDYGDSAA